MARKSDSSNVIAVTGERDLIEEKIQLIYGRPSRLRIVHFSLEVVRGQSQ